MIKINGKEYPLWSQFVEGKEKWIGGILEDLDDDPIIIKHGDAKTEIIYIQLVANGKEGAFFEVCGKDFNCGFACEIGGVIPGDDGWTTFMGYQGHTWRIKKRETK